MRAALVLPLVMALGGCLSPREACMNDATADLRTLNRLIAESEVNLTRGFGYERHQVVRPTWGMCGGYWDDDWPGGMCYEPMVQTIRRPVAIDPAVETRKLEMLKSRRAALNARAAAVVATCEARYPVAAAPRPAP